MSKRDDDFYRLAKERAAAASEAAMLRMLSGKRKKGPEPERTEAKPSEVNRDRAAYQREYRARNREKFVAYEREYAERNREKLNAYHREYRKTHRDRMTAYQREYYARNRDRVLDRVRKRYREDGDSRREYAERNRERLNAYQRERYARRMATLERRKAELSGSEPFFRWAISLSPDDRAKLLEVAGRNPRLRMTMIEERQ